MKSLKTYNMEHSTIKILNSKSNKSQYVNFAVQRMHSQEMHFDITNVSTKQLYAVILARMTAHDPLRALIVQRIESL